MAAEGPSRGAVEPPWGDYAETVLEVALPGWTAVLSPLPDDAASGEGPVGGSAAPEASPLLPAPLPAPWWVVTACNPHPLVLPDEENLQRDEALVADLDAAGVAHHPAVGRSPDATWVEVGRALVGVDRATALAHARAYDQAAVFEVDDRVRVIACADGRIVSSRAYRLQGAR